MIQIGILGLGGLCFAIGMFRLTKAPTDAPQPGQANPKSEAVKLVLASSVVIAIGVGLSFM